MDLREKKTIRSIKNAFLEIRSRTPLERITVKELCERAEISKATFYLHYRDIYDLSDILQMEIIKSIIDSIQNVEDMIYDPCKVSRETVDAFFANRSMINILFSGSQFARLPEQLESEIKSTLFEKYPDLKDDVYVNVRITYQLMGSFYSYYKYENIFGFDKVRTSVNDITRLFEKAIRHDKSIPYSQSIEE